MYKKQVYRKCQDGRILVDCYDENGVLTDTCELSEITGCVNTTVRTFIRTYSDNFSTDDDSMVTEFFDNGDMILSIKTKNRCYVKSSFNKDNNILWMKIYEDDKFEGLKETYLYDKLENGDTVIKYQYNNPTEEFNFLSSITVKTPDGKIDKEKIYYKDVNFKDFLAKETIFYIKYPDYYKKEYILSEPQNNVLSKELYFKKGKLHEIYYKESNFKGKVKEIFGKKNRKGEKIFLTIFNEKQNNFLSQIEKRTADNKQKYKKGYKINNILVKILYFLKV